jgi:hypothetical protein
MIKPAQVTVLTMMMLTAFTLDARAQTGNQPFPGTPGSNGPGSQTRINGGMRSQDPITLPAETMHRLEASRENERQKKMVVDTEHLLALATELKTDMDKTNKNILSVDVIKKAEEIEKLAHDIKQRMRE